jgi:hypothetical protein
VLAQIKFALGDLDKVLGHSAQRSSFAPDFLKPPDERRPT